MVREIQAILPDEYLKEIDELIRKRIFKSREQVLRISLESLLELSEEEIKKMKEARAEVNSYLTGKVGDILSAGQAIKVIVNKKEYYKIPVRGIYNNKIYTYGYVYIDSNSMQIDDEISDPPQKIHKNAELLVNP